MTSKNDKYNISTHIFENGLRLIYEPPHTSLPITSINAFCDVGSVNEPDNLRGAVHFIEHMCFKGTKKIPKAKNIYLAYDDVGAILNALTNKQYTRYVVKTAVDYTHNCIDMMSDMMLNSTFNHTEFVKEQKVVTEETLRLADNAAADVANMADADIYSGTPYEWPVDTFAYHDNKQYDYKSIINLYHKYYHPSRIVLSIVSPLSFETIVGMVKKSYFSKKVKQLLDIPLVDAEPIGMDYKGKVGRDFKGKVGSFNFESKVGRDFKGTVGSLNFKNKPNTETTHLTISFRTCNMHSPDKFVLDVLQHILSGTFGSILANLLREKNGLTYSSKADTAYYECSGDLTIYAQVNNRKLIKAGLNTKHNTTVSKKRTKSYKPGVLPLLLKLISNLVKHGVTEKELTVAKNNIHGKMIIGLEDSMTQSAHNGEKLLLYPDETVVPLDQIYDVYVKPVSAKQVHDVIKKYFRNDNMYINIVGGLKSFDAY